MKLALGPPRRMEWNDTLRTMRRLLFRRYPLSVPSARLSCNPFFIVGAGRSGNTLLRAMLMTGPEVAIPPESFVLPSIIRNFLLNSHLLWPDVVRLVIAEFQLYPDFTYWRLDLGQSFERAVALGPGDRSLAAVLDTIYMDYARQEKPAARRWGDKTPLNTLHIERLNWPFPEAQFVHLIRDGRDVVASYLEAGFYKTIDAAAERWLASIRRARAFGRALSSARYVELRYEDLVTDPDATLRHLCAFLALPYRSDMLDFWQHSDTLGDAQLRHHSNLSRPLSRGSIGRWQTMFSAAEQAQLERQLGPALIELGYGASA